MENTQEARPLNILIAEDEENIAIALEAVIKQSFKNAQVRLVADGEAAWQALKDGDFDLILAD